MKPIFEENIFIHPPEGISSFNIDKFCTIPEPSSIVLFIIAVGLFFLFKWRKQFNPRNVPVKMNDLI